MSIYYLLAQKLASIQPRTSPVKYARSPCTDPPGERRDGRSRADAQASIVRLLPPSERPEPVACRAELRAAVTELRDVVTELRAVSAEFSAVGPELSLRIICM